MQDVTANNFPLENTPLQSVNELGKTLLKFAFEGNIREVRALLAQGSPFISDWVKTTIVDTKYHKHVPYLLIAGD